MKSIVEVLEIGLPKSLIQRENSPTSELIDTQILINELNIYLADRINKERFTFLPYIPPCAQEYRKEYDLDESDNSPLDFGYSFEVGV